MTDSKRKVPVNSFGKAVVDATIARTMRGLQSTPRREQDAVQRREACILHVCHGSVACFR
jgi:hypothetical protein